MTRFAWSVLIILVSLISCSSPKPALVKTQAKCSYDRAQLMALDEQHFDQDPKGGWRTIAYIPGCESTAADLIRDYRKAHRSQSYILYWHEAQVRAVAGDYKRAIPLMEKSRKPEKTDFGGWNYYVDASIAFLRKDKAALADARSKLAKLQPAPGMSPVKDGLIDVHMPNGQIVKERWPFNLDFVDGFIRCFDKPYIVAYRSKDCHSVLHQ